MSRSSDPEISPCSGLALAPVISSPSRAGEAGAADLPETRAELSLAQLGHPERLVRGKPGLLERVGEGVVADVVQQGREADRQAVVVGDEVELAPLLQARQRASREVVGAERVLEPGVGRAGIDQEGVTDLADVSESLHRSGVQREQRRPVEPDVVPEGVADDLDVLGVDHDSET